jgi:cytochrome c oxidase cbb3-type subunit 4
MDINDLRIAVTLASLVLFLALMVHTWSRRRSAEHADAALLPFMGGDDAPVQAPDKSPRIQGQTQGEAA